MTVRGVGASELGCEFVNAFGGKCLVDWTKGIVWTEEA